MTNQEVFDSALRIIGEEPGAADLADYTARAPYLLCSACRALAGVDRMYRLAHRVGVLVLPRDSEYALDSLFPLSDALHPTAAYHIAAALIFDENPALSDKCHARFVEQTKDILDALPARVELIGQKY
ncbi:MAG: hypothetical protein IKL84_08265 [Clostridia bacterium]|nr:hypothetical protein [Clostridia bacterium]